MMDSESPIVSTSQDPIKTSSGQTPSDGVVPLNSKLIFSSDFSQVKDSVLDLSSTATPCRYRLMDMNCFLEHHKLVIYEFSDFPNAHRAYYSAISYVWRGNPLISDPSSPSYWIEELGTFSVKGAEDGDPISLDVLYHVCTAILSCSYSGSYLWLDRLCIIQSSKEDKAWQIKQMHDIYRYCKICCILPGGIQRLVTLDEETAWIERAWTLQEALLPHRTIVLFLLDEDRLEELESAKKKVRVYCPITYVIPDLSAYGELRPLLELSLSSTVAGRAVSIFGKKRAPVAALYGAAIKQNTHSYIEKDLKEQMIWRCALMRTSSRPVDMVFSIMGLFSVTLDPLEFGKADRVRATIALASRMVSYIGGRASWLTAAYQLEPCAQLSSFPQFPDTSVDGNAYYGASTTSLLALKNPLRSETLKSRLVADIVEERCDLDRWLSGLPEGAMDEYGYLTFTSRAVQLVPASGNTASLDGPWTNLPVNNPFKDAVTGKVCVHAENRSVWHVYDDGPRPHGSSATPRTFAVYLGRQESYVDLRLGQSPETPGINACALSVHLDDTSRWKRRREIVLLIQEHSPGKFHRVSYMKFDDGFENVIPGFTNIMVSVGGPEHTVDCT